MDLSNTMNCKWLTLIDMICNEQ